MLIDILFLIVYGLIFWVEFKKNGFRGVWTWIALLMIIVSGLCIVARMVA